MFVFKTSGIRITDDISIIGLDNIALTEIVSPALTIMELERYRIGKTSIELLLNRIKDKKLPKQTCIFKTKLKFQLISNFLLFLNCFFIIVVKFQEIFGDIVLPVAYKNLNENYLTLIFLLI
ncbi:MAG: LacI family transcriptional regulator [Actinobacteria bacterium]|nr:LacI family transcriptional regulator [Candidatus Poribacteria bacterium]MBM3702159.1 LacI family transcriptional regulator [Actinomycetota bacterium]